MKKLKGKNKLYLIHSSKKKQLHNLRRKLKRLKLKSISVIQKIKDHRANRFIKNYKKVKHQLCNAPSELSIVDDPVSVIKYFNTAKEALAKNIPVFFDLRNVTKMGPETLTYFCALINEESFTKGTVLQGNAPNEPHLREMFLKAGFYNFVKSNRAPINYMRDVDGELVHKITRKKVESVLAGKVSESAKIHTFGENDLKSRSIYSILIEAMANTHNHASRDINVQIYNWWLLAYKDPTTKITKFCFLDLGIGIFSSLSKKYSEKNLTERLMKLVTPSDSKKTLEKIFSGKKKMTSIGLPGRGLGLKNVYNLVKGDPNIKNFTLVSNDIIAKIGYNTPDDINKLKTSFEGTLFYWELVPTI